VILVPVRNAMALGGSLKMGLNPTFSVVYLGPSPFVNGPKSVVSNH